MWKDLQWGYVCPQGLFGMPTEARPIAHSKWMWYAKQKTPCVDSWDYKMNTRNTQTSRWQFCGLTSWLKYMTSKVASWNWHMNALCAEPLGLSSWLKSSWDLDPGFKSELAPPECFMLTKPAPHLHPRMTSMASRFIYVHDCEEKPPVLVTLKRTHVILQNFMTKTSRWCDWDPVQRALQETPGAPMNGLWHCIYSSASSEGSIWRVLMIYMLASILLTATLVFIALLSRKPSHRWMLSPYVPLPNTSLTSNECMRSLASTKVCPIATD